MRSVTIHVDGSSRGNSGRGGWAAILSSYSISKKMPVVKEFFGTIDYCTNQQAELTAVIEGLSRLKEPCKVTLVSDSQYVVLGISRWLQGWKNNNWRTSSHAPVKNKDLWERLDTLLQTHSTEAIFVRGHKDNTFNIRADELATAASE